MLTHDVQSIAINAPADQVFAFVAAPANLPRWTNAFAAADDRSAAMRTPAGEVSIKLETTAAAVTGVVDWRMTFPDGAVGAAYSRVTPDGARRCVYSFVLMAPPAPLEALEGALAAQSETLRGELARLKALMEAP